jgi:CrcB protein
LIKFLTIGIGGFVGALLRYGVSGWVYSFSRNDFPYGTLAVNIAGSFILGLIVGLGEQYIMHPNLKLFLTIGVLGAFTTFSTFSYETIILLQLSSYLKAFVNVSFSVFLGLIAAFIGLAAGKAL